jgi:hypothetical protein
LDKKKKRNYIMAENVPPLLIFLIIAVAIVTIFDAAPTLIQFIRNREEIPHHKSGAKPSSIPEKNCNTSGCREDADNSPQDN